MSIFKTSLLLDPGTWDGTHTTFRLWWAKMKAWAQDQLERETMDKEIGQAIAMHLQGKVEGFALQLFEEVEVSKEWPTWEGKGGLRAHIEKWFGDMQRPEHTLRELHILKQGN